MGEIEVRAASITPEMFDRGIDTVRRLAADGKCSTVRMPAAAVFEKYHGGITYSTYIRACWTQWVSEVTSND
jgi:hypothetical protein